MSLTTGIGKLKRALGEAAACGPGALCTYSVGVIVKLPEILRAGNLSAVDRGMRGRFTIRYRGAHLILPAGAMDDVSDPGDSPAFAGLREMYARDVYLRAFRRTPRAQSVIDLGANRGLFAVIAAKALGCERYVGVEPNASYLRPFEVLADANGLSPEQREREIALAGSSIDEGVVTVTELAERRGIDRIGFLKCDIEGGENEVFLGDGQFLARTDTIAMELHPTCGARSREIAATIAHHGFRLTLRDERMAPAEPDDATYLFASRDDTLLEVH